jgi:hypothetical protein
MKERDEIDELAHQFKINMLEKYAQGYLDGVSELRTGKDRTQPEQWRPIGTAPKGTDPMLLWADSRGCFIGCRDKNDLTVWLQHTTTFSIPRVTHWMPLPPKPCEVVK